jgi:hypothetical protein
MNVACLQQITLSEVQVQQNEKQEYVILIVDILTQICELHDVYTYII